MPDLPTALSILAKAILYVGVVLAVGGALFDLAFGDRAHPLRGRLTASVLLGALAAGLGAGAQFGLQAAVLAGGGLAGFADPEMAQLLWETQAGSALLALGVGLCLLILSRLLAGGARKLFSVLGAVSTVTSFTLVGHANDGPAGLMHALVALHLLGVSYWIGALWPLRAAALGAVPLAEAGDLAERFGALAALVVPVLIAAGGAAAWLLLGSIEAALSTSYGFVLIGKLAVVAALLGLAAVNKLSLTPAMKRGDAQAGAALARSIKYEAYAAGAIFAATGALTTATSLPA